MLTQSKTLEAIISVFIYKYNIIFIKLGSYDRMSKVTFSVDHYEVKLVQLYQHKSPHPTIDIF